MTAAAGSSAFRRPTCESTNELLPAFGIYATLAVVDDVTHPAVTSVGVRPTIGDGRVTVETFLLDGSHDLYGKRLRLAFVKWIREELKFDDLAALTARIADDCATGGGNPGEDLGLIGSVPTCPTRFS